MDDDDYDDDDDDDDDADDENSENEKSPKLLGEGVIKKTPQTLSVRQLQGSVRK